MIITAACGFVGASGRGLCPPVMFYRSSCGKGVLMRLGCLASALLPVSLPTQPHSAADRMSMRKSGMNIPFYLTRRGRSGKPPWPEL